MWAQNDHLGTEAGYPDESIKLAIGISASSQIEQQTSTGLGDQYPDLSGVFGTDSSEPITSEDLYDVELHPLIDFLGIINKNWSSLGRFLS